jgi:hypothetical protein
MSMPYSCPMPLPSPQTIAVLMTFSVPSVASVVRTPCFCETNRDRSQPNPQQGVATNRRALARDRISGRLTVDT